MRSVLLALRDCLLFYCQRLLQTVSNLYTANPPHQALNVMHSLFLLADMACCALLLLLEAFVKEMVVNAADQMGSSPPAGPTQGVYHALGCG